MGKVSEFDIWVEYLGKGTRLEMTSETHTSSEDCFVQDSRLGTFELCDVNHFCTISCGWSSLL